MVDPLVQRRLAAIAVTDVVGYSRLMGEDEAGTLAALRDRRASILEPVVLAHAGRIVKLMGDGALIEFASALNAVDAALELQSRMGTANEALPEHRRIVLRIGINLGEVIGEGSDIYGDGVNIAARLEALAEPGGVCVSGKIRAEVDRKGDHVFEDLGEVELRNIVEPVRVYRVRRGEREASRPAGKVTAAKPSIAVLPFDNLSGDPGQQYLSDGITEDIITELSRFRSLSVLGRHSSFHLGGKGADPIQAARKLGADYAVEGSVRKAGERIRITAQLIDARSGDHVWAERYDRESRDVFAVQDEVVSAIAATLEGRTVAAAAIQVRRRPAANWTAYDFFLKGRELADASLEKEAVPFFSAAVEIDPDFALAHAWQAMALLGRYWFDADVQTLQMAADAAHRALELDSNDPTVHHANGMVTLWLRQPERAALHFDRAIALNPVDVQVRGDRANLLRYTGRPQEALNAIDEELRRSQYPPIWFWRVRGGILLELNKYSEAIEAFGNIPRKDHFTWIQLAAAYGYLGVFDAASNALARARELRPSISLIELLTVVPYTHQASLDHLVEGLRLAGLTK